MRLTVGTMILPLLLNLVVTISARPAKAQKGDPKPFAVTQWKLNTEFGFPVWIAEYIKPDWYAPYWRNVYVYLEPGNFHEENLKRLFLGLAASQNMDLELFIRVSSDKQTLAESIKPEAGHYNNSKSAHAMKAEEVRRVSRPVYWANYARTSEREAFDYNPNPTKDEIATVIIRRRSIPYTGSADSDLVLAAADGDTGRVAQLLANGAFVNASRKDGSTALMLAVLKRQDEVTRLLLAGGADINAKNLEGWTALMYAVTNTDIDTVRTLLESYAEANARNASGDSSLMLAIYKGSKDIAKVLLEKGAEIDVQDEDGNTALTIAVLNSNREIIDLLLAAGANTRLRNKQGRTALMIAEQKANDHQAIIDLVVREAARGPHLTKIDGQKAKLYAEQNGLEEIINLLKQR